MPAQASPLLRGALRAGLACAAVPLALAAFELGYRAQAHRPVFALDDWRAARIAYLAYGERNAFDPFVGWVPYAGYESAGYNTLDLGIRRNSTEDKVRTGGVLAVGDVFTDGGAEVKDGETWPAQLERIAGQPVLNAGVPGYGIDQVVLRAERLLPQVQPRTLVVGLHEAAIARAGLSSYGSPKPWFTLESGRLVLHAPAQAAIDMPSGWPAVLGRSAVLDAVISNLAPGYWQGKAGDIHASVVNDPAGVACALLERLKRRADGDGIRMVLLLQYARSTTDGKTAPGADVKAVVACAGTAGIEIVDTLAELRALVAADPGALARLYLPEGEGDGQMSAEGNRRSAERLAAALGK
jgi:hypothetical protein